MTFKQYTVPVQIQKCSHWPSDELKTAKKLGISKGSWEHVKSDDF